MKTKNMQNAQEVENAAAPQRGIKKYVPVFEIVSFTILFLYALSLLIPFLWSLMTSFKTNDDFLYYPLKWPSVFKWDNYITVFEYFYAPSEQPQGEDVLVGAGIMLLNSLWYALGTSLISISFQILRSDLYSCYFADDYSHRRYAAFRVENCASHGDV